MPPDVPVRLAEDLPLWELVQTYHPVARGFGEVFAAAGLTPTQFGVLVALAEADPQGPGPSQAELARQVLVRPQSMGELIGSLLDRGLVIRDGPGGRGRRGRLWISEDGHRALERSVPAVNDYNAPARLGLTPDEAAVLARLLRTVRSALSDAERG